MSSYRYQVRPDPDAVTEDDVERMKSDGSLATRLVDETLLEHSHRRVTFPAWFELLDMELQSRIIHSIGARLRAAHARA